MGSLQMVFQEEKRKAQPIIKLMNHTSKRSTLGHSTEQQTVRTEAERCRQMLALVDKHCFLKPTRK